MILHQNPLRTVAELHRSAALDVDMQQSNRYCIRLNTPNGKEGYYFASPIYNAYSRKLVRRLFLQSGFEFRFCGSNCSVTVTGTQISLRQEDRSLTLTTNPTQGVFLAEPVQAVLNPDRTTVRQQGRRIKEVGEPMFTLTAQDRHGIRIGGRIRRLTPLEYWRLQGFTDEQFAKLAPGNFGDRRLYQMAGNAVTVTVIQAIAEWLLQIFNEMKTT